MTHSKKIIRCFKQATVGAALAAMTLLNSSCSKSDPVNPAAVDIPQDEKVANAAALALAGSGGLGSLIGGGSGALGGLVSQKGSIFEFQHGKVGFRPGNLGGIVSRSMKTETEECPGGGFLEVNCESDDTSSRILLSGEGCQLVPADQGIESSLQGTVTVDANAPNACENGFDGVTEIRADIDNVKFELRVPEEGIATVIEADATIEIKTEESEGCLGTAASLGLHGSLRVASNAGGETVDQVMTARNLQISLDSRIQSEGESCEIAIGMNGELDYEDRAKGESFSARYSEFRYAFTISPMGIAVTYEGVATNECLGDIQYTTIEPIRFAAGSSCPTAGIVDITLLGDESTSRVTFKEDGSVEIDVGIDGSVDRTFASCSDMSGPENCRL